MAKPGPAGTAILNPSTRLGGGYRPLTTVRGIAGYWRRRRRSSVPHNSRLRRWIAQPKHMALSMCNWVWPVTRPGAEPPRASRDLLPEGHGRIRRGDLLAPVGAQAGDRILKPIPGLILPALSSGHRNMSGKVAGRACDSRGPAPGVGSTRKRSPRIVAASGCSDRSAAAGIGEGGRSCSRWSRAARGCAVAEYTWTPAATVKARWSAIPSPDPR